MKILHVMAGEKIGGEEKFFESLVLALHRFKVDQRVIINKNHTRKDVLQRAGVKVLEVPFGGRFDFKTGYYFKKAIDKFKPYIVMTWKEKANLLCPEGPFVHISRIGHYQELDSFETCDHIMANAKDLVYHLIRKDWPASRAHFLPPFISKKPTKIIQRKDLYVPSNAPFFLTGGYLKKDKGFENLFDAVRLIPEIYVCLAGDGPDKDYLISYAQKVGVKPRIRFLGWRDDMSDLFSSSDFFVCPFKKEPVGTIILEAWAYQSPVIAIDSIGAGTLIDQGKTGELVPVGKPELLAKAIKKFMKEKDYRQELAENAFAVFEENFSEEKVIPQYQLFFERIHQEYQQRDENI